MKMTTPLLPRVTLLPAPVTGWDRAGGLYEVLRTSALLYGILDFKAPKASAVATCGFLAAK
jgi:hypothetical protein